jgi:tetratricopeptide (TPR) repeat protein
VRLGFAYQELGQFDRAIPSFEAARAAGGSDPVFDAYLAQALIEAGQAPRALEIASAARKTRPDDLRFVRLEADALARSGQLDAAISLLETQAQQHDDRAELPLTLAALCTEHDRFDRADAVLTAAEKRFPQNVLVAFQRGAMLERQERYAEAEQAFRRALTLDPLHGPTLNYIGYMLAERGQQLDDAVSMLKRALQTDPYNGSYLDSLGWAHFMRGELDQARRYLALAVERLPRNSVVQDHWSDLLLKQGDRDAAGAAWERALAGDRESIDAAAITRTIEDARRAKP